MKKMWITALKILLLSIVFFLCMAVSSSILVIHSKSMSDGAVFPVLLYCLFTSAMVSMVVLNSDKTGYRLAADSFFICWGVQYFMTQIETLFFNSAVQMPLADIVRNVCNGALYTAAGCLVAVKLFGRWKRTGEKTERKKNDLPRRFFPKLIALSVVYVLIYFLFGYFVAWQFPALRGYYSGSTQILNFFDHMRNQLSGDPALPIFQLFRGLLWGLLSVLMMNTLNIKNKWLSILAPGVLYSVLITVMLLFPNAYMPTAVRIGHSYELSTSMMTFGILSSLILGLKKNRLDETN